MLKAILFSVALSALLIYGMLRLQTIYEARQPERVVRIDIHPDRITYRTGSYATASLLAIGIKAAGEPPEIVALHSCERMADLEAVVDLLREQDYMSFAVELPTDC